MSHCLNLASRSPRRRELLEQIGVAYRLVEADVDESVEEGEPPLQYVQRVARDKARIGADRIDDGPTLGADTSVVLGDRIMGKPRDENDAVDMLLALAGRIHQVISAVAVIHAGNLYEDVSISQVTFADFGETQARAYWQTGEPRGKAGAYAIQGRGAQFVQHLEGSYSGVMGLPLFETARLCRRVGIQTLEQPA